MLTIFPDGVQFYLWQLNLLLLQLLNNLLIFLKPEFCNNDLKHYLQDKGITYQLTVPYNSFQNGVNERKHLNVQEKARLFFLNLVYNLIFGPKLLKLLSLLSIDIRLMFSMVILLTNYGWAGFLIIQFFIFLVANAWY